MKVVPKLATYNGEVAKFAAFQEDLKDYLEIVDARWRRLMEVIEAAKDPILDSNVTDIADKARIPQDQLENFRQQFLVYLKAFTGGAANRMAATGGSQKSFEVYRLFCEQGRSRRPEHLLELRNRINNPASAKSLATLPAVITAWEAEVEYMKRVKPDEPENMEDRRLQLMNLCPADLRNHLKKETFRWPRYHEVIVEIFDYIARSSSTSTATASAKSLTIETLKAFISDDAEDDEWEDWDVSEDQLAEIPEEHHGTIMALIKNTNCKMGKGGKGKGR